MSNVGSANVNITADDSQARKKIGGLVGFLKGAGKTAATAVAGVAIFSGITAGIKTVITSGARYEQSMSKVQAVTRASADEMQQLDTMARELGKSTKYSASEASEAMSYLGMAGFDTSQILQSMPSLLDLAASGNLDLGRAADIASNILSGFNLNADQTGHVSDVLALSAASANTSVEQMGNAMSYVAPVAQGAGISLEETAGAIGVLSNAGIQGERAGTALRGMIAKLQSPTKATKDALKDMGLSISDVNPATNSLTEILKTLEGVGLNSAQAMELVGVEAGPALLAMLTQGSQGLKDMTTSLENADGSAKEMATTMSNNLAGKWKAFLSAMENISLVVYEKIKPALEDLVTSMTNLARIIGDNIGPAIEKFIEVMTPIVQKVQEIGQAVLSWKPLLPIVTGLGAAFVTLLIANKVAKGVALLRGAILIMANPLSRALFLTQVWTKAQALLNATLFANPIGLVIAILVGLGVALVVAYKKSETFRNIVNNAWASVKAGFQSFLSFFTTTLPAWYQSVVSWFTNMKATVTARVGQLVAVVTQWWRNLQQRTLQIVLSLVNSTVQWFVNLKNRAVQQVTNLGNLISTKWQQIKLVVTTLISSFVQNAIQIFTTWYQRVKTNILDPFVTFFRSTFQNIKLIVLGIITSLISIFTGDMEGFKLGVLAILTGFKRQAVNIFNLFKTLLVNIGKSLWNVLKILFNAGKSALIAVVNLTKNGIVNGFRFLKNSVISIGKALWNLLKSLFTGGKNALIATGQAIKNGVVNGFNALKNGAVNAFKSMVSSVKNFFSNLKNDSINKANAIRDGVRNGFNNAKEYAISAVIGMYNSVTTWLSNVRGKFSDMKSDIIKKVSSIDLYEIGKDVVRGLVNGLGSMIQSVKKKAKEIADKVKEATANALRLGSPSREMEDQGVFTVQGLIRGLSKMGASAAKKAKDIGKKVKDGFQNELKDTSAVLEDGDNTNDWLNRMNKQTRTKTYFIGKQLAKFDKGNIGGEVHNHQWNVNADNINDVQKLIAMINGISQTVKSR